MPKLHYQSLLMRVILRLDAARSLLTRKIKSTLNIEVEYMIGSRTIFLPAYHLLPLYQGQHRLYDRFLPHLVSYLEASAVVIDVGANCGDTLVAMFDSNKTLNYICVEPDTVFFSFLLKNIKRLKNVDTKISITAIQALVGIGVTGAVLDGSGGTKRAIITDGSKLTLSKTLDAIVAGASVDAVRLLKSDVDGFDYDVLDSAPSVLAADSPILYFECDIYKEEQSIGFRKTILKLWESGYRKWIVFDNFGDVMISDATAKQVLQLIEYVWRQNSDKSTRTIYYFDFLASTDKDSNLIDLVIEQFLSKYSTDGA